MDIEKIKNNFDFSEVVGKPVVIDEKTTVIPLSKVSVGYVGGQGNALKKTIRKRRTSTQADSE
ncbi:MAG: GerW family sporulation protein [Clostridiales bacterium]|nr:MAG: GerW family sporulation protein [Clostridiales bacterium]